MFPGMQLLKGGGFACFLVLFYSNVTHTHIVKAHLLFF